MWICGIIEQKFFLSFTLYPVYSRVGGANLGTWCSDIIVRLMLVPYKRATVDETIVVRFPLEGINI